MKKFLSLTLSLALAFSLCACSSSATPPAASPAPELASAPKAALTAPSPVPVETQSVSPSATPAAPASPAASPVPSPEPTPNPALAYITDVYSSQGEYIDGVGNKYEYSFSVPRFDLAGSAAEAVNTNIADMLSPLVDEAAELMRGGYSLSIVSIDHDAYLNGDILSLVARVNYDADYTDYYVWNMNVSTRAIADEDELFAYTEMGTDGTPLLSVVSGCAGAYCAALYKDLNNSFAREQYDKTLSIDNLSLAQYYLDAGGTMQAIVKVYQLAGAETCSTVIALHR